MGDDLRAPSLRLAELAEELMEAWPDDIGLGLAKAILENSEQLKQIAMEHEERRETVSRVEKILEVFDEEDDSPAYVKTKRLGR